MPSLAAHLRKSDAHGQLPFHPSCPICRQTRLVGSLATRGVVAPRTSAVLAAGLLAVSAGAPAATALAQDGPTPVTPSGSPDPTDSPDYDPGDESPQMPDVPQPPGAPIPTDGDDDGGAPVDQEPTGDVSDPVPDLDDDSGTPAAPAPMPTATEPDPSPAPVSPEPTPTPVPTPTANPSAETAPAATPAPTPVPTAVPLAHSRVHKAHRHPQPQTAHPRPAPSIVSKPVRSVGYQAPSTATSVVVRMAPPVVRPAPRLVAARTTAHPARPRDHVHTVHPGESLWAIASDVLGGDASPAQVAREVHRLWTLNKDRIGTGNPDLLMVGTRLALR
jgi:hypothetical protein